MLKINPCFECHGEIKTGGKRIFPEMTVKIDDDRHHNKRVKFHHECYNKFWKKYSDARGSRLAELDKELKAWAVEHDK